MDDILNTLAFSMYSNKGVYALLLGSGISAPAGIPTGWDVLMNLIQKLAACEKEYDIKDAHRWYEAKFGKEPDYSDILSILVKTQTERVALMRPYFEPNEEERESGLKAPTAAHSAIAKLVKKGYVKVIMTTNFDRLLEKSLEAEGITPQVINHEDDIAGATPIVHAPCTIVKINGDYVDCRFRNTSEELATYPPKWSEYISRIVEDFGVITCGWSGLWDKALSELIIKSANSRYNSIFAYKDTYSETLNEICVSRRGELINIHNADYFFKEITERILALEDMENPTLSKDIAVARVKRYLTKPEHRIQLNDLFREETRKAQSAINTVGNYNIRLNAENFDSFWELHRGAVDKLVPMCTTATQWCDETNEDVIINVIRSIAQPPKSIQSHTDAGKCLHYLSALTLLYTTGFTCIVFAKFRLLKKIFSLSIPDFMSPHRYPLIYIVNSQSTWNHDALNRALGQNWKTPMSTFLDNNLADNLMPFVESEEEYKIYFDIFERMLSLNYLWICGGDKYYGGDWLPWGEYHWRRRQNRNIEGNPWDVFFNQADTLQNEWEPIKDGMFDGSYDVYTDIKNRADAFLSKIYLR